MRGINADIIVVEEAAFIDVHVYEQIIVPLIGMRKSVVVMISTPLDSFNYFSQLLDLRDKLGQPLFLIARMEMACKRCKELNREHLCKHRMKFLPPWKSEEKSDIMQLLLRNKADTMARENMGSIKDAGNSFIEKTTLDRWFDPAQNVPFVPRPMEKADVVVVGIDPSGGDGKNASEVAVTSVAMTWNNNVVSLLVFRIRVWQGRVQRARCTRAAPAA